MVSHGAADSADYLFWKRNCVGSPQWDSVRGKLPTTQFREGCKLQDNDRNLVETRFLSLQNATPMVW